MVSLKDLLTTKMTSPVHAWLAQSTTSPWVLHIPRWPLKKSCRQQYVANTCPSLSRARGVPACGSTVRASNPGCLWCIRLLTTHNFQAWTSFGRISKRGAMELSRCGAVVAWIAGLVFMNICHQPRCVLARSMELHTASRTLSVHSEWQPLLKKAMSKRVNTCCNFSS